MAAIKDSNPIYRLDNLDKTKRRPILNVLLSVNNLMAGRESGAGNPLFTDFTLAGQKLEQLGFTYYKGTVLVIDSLKMEM
jgi:hypothetical protein